jgi:hypothetical protein
VDVLADDLVLGGAQRARLIARATFNQSSPMPRVAITQSSSFIAWVEATSADLWIPFIELPANQ